MELDRLKHTARRAGRDLDVTPKELQLLEYLLIVGGSILLATRPRRAEERGRPRGLATSPSGSSVTGTGGA